MTYHINQKVNIWIRYTIDVNSDNPEEVLKQWAEGDSKDMEYLHDTVEFLKSDPCNPHTLEVYDGRELILLK